MSTTINNENIIVSAYDTTFGKLIQIEKVKRELLKFITELEVKNMNYEFTFKKISTDNSLDNRLMFITGFSDIEKELPIWDYPIIVENLKHEKIVCVDLRKYMKQLKEQPLSITAEAKDKSSVTLLAMSAMLTLEFSMGNTGMLSNYYKHITTAYTMLLASMINNIIPLNPSERMAVEIAIAFHANYLFVNPTDVHDYRDNIVARLSTMRYTIPPTKDVIKEVSEPLVGNDKTINGLVANITAVMTESKKMFITKDLITNILAGQWYGTNGSAGMIVALEHMPTWIAMFSSVISDVTFKKSKLALILDRYSKQIGVPDAIKGMNNYMSERISDY